MLLVEQGAEKQLMLQSLADIGGAHFFLFTIPVFVKYCCRCSMLPSANTLSRFAALRLKGFTGFGAPV